MGAHDAIVGQLDHEIRERSERPACLRALADNEEVHMVAFAYGDGLL